MKRNNTFFALPVSLTAPALAILVALAGCSFNNPQSSPDVVYSDASSGAKQLQIPPDLNSVNNGEQFILPGNELGPLSRNRLLPAFTGAKYVRQGGQNWLELSQGAESVWPLVLEFIRKQKWAVEKTVPNTGTVFTQWRSGTEKSGGLLKNLISNETLYSRYSFRLERNGNGTRVFARGMQLTGEAIEQATEQATVDQWPESSHNPEQVSQVLSRLLIFLGAEEQQVEGILSEPQASAILDDAEVQTTAAGSQLVLHKAFTPAFVDIKAAVNDLAYTVIQSDASVGSLQVSTSVDATPMLISLTPVHISAVRVLVTQVGGARLDKAEEIDILSALQGQII